MRQMRLFFAIGMLAVLFTACEEDFQYYKTIDFEDVVLGSAGYYNGSDKSGVFENGSYKKHIKSSIASFVNEYAESEWGGYWKGFSVSSKTDTLTAGYGNQYSCMARSASSKFGLAYASTGDSAVFWLKPAVDASESMELLRPRKMMITNAVYTYLSMRDGDAFSRKFTAGDWYKVIIRGYTNTSKTGELEFYLADFRGGKSIIVNDWTEVDLRTLGTPDRIVFSFDSSDQSAGWINTPAYACIDNIVIEYSGR